MGDVTKLSEEELMDLLVTYTTNYTQTLKDSGTDHRLFKTYINQIVDELATRKGVCTTGKEERDSLSNRRIN